MAFDIEGARSAGYSDAEIADHLSKQNNFDAASARKAGYTDEQIIGHLSMPEKMPEPPKPQGFGAQLEAGIKEVPRQLGLTARYGLEGVTGAMGFAVDPLLSVAGLPTVAGGGKQTADMLGLPTPQTSQERVVGDVSRMMAGAGGFAGVAGQGAKVAEGGAKEALKFLSSNPASQITGAAGAGAGSGYVRETGGGPAAQLVGATGGALFGGALPSAIKSADSIIRNTISGSKAGAQSMDVRLERILAPELEKSGVKWGDLPYNVRETLKRETEKASRLGPLDDNAVRRLADYTLVGGTPTRAGVTLDPSIITQERNMAKLSANLSDGGLPAIQNSNMKRMVENLDDLGASRATDSLSTGSKIVDAIQAKDARAQAIERGLYGAARDTAGRAAPLDRASFINRADELLALDGKHAFLPDQIKTKLNQISLGQIKTGGNTYDVPFNVDVINGLKTELATAQRATTDGNVKRAIGLVRQALDETPIGDAVPAESMKAFDRARQFARARRTWQESAPAIQDALDGIPPDRFVDTYIIGQTSKASAADVAKLANELQKAGAKDSVKTYLAAYLKKQATGDAIDAATADATRFSAAGFNRALDQLGDAKLKMFFSPEEVAQLRAIGRMAKYETAQPTGSAVNNSNTAATAFAKMLDFIGNSKIVSRIPFGDAAVRQPAQNWALQLKMDQARNIAPSMANQTPRPGVAGALTVPALIAPGLLSNN